MKFHRFQSCHGPAQFFSGGVLSIRCWQQALDEHLLPEAEKEVAALCVHVQLSSSFEIHRQGLAVIGNSQGRGKEVGNLLLEKIMCL